LRACHQARSASYRSANVAAILEFNVTVAWRDNGFFAQRDSARLESL
jgi:hypothetical protein